MAGTARRIDGHDPAQVEGALTEAQGSDRPTLIACRTTIGYGAPTKGGTASDPRLAARRRTRSPARASGSAGPTRPFEIPEPILEAWRAIGRRGAAARDAWQARLAAKDASAQGRVRAGPRRPAARGAGSGPARPQAQAGRGAAELGDPQVEPGSAAGADRRDPRDGRRLGRPHPLQQHRHQVDARAQSGEHPAAATSTTACASTRMVAAMNGIALHRGLIPYGGTFLIFSDYCRPAIRLACLMRQRVIIVFTHDFHRARRGRPDPPADRASRQPARDAQSARHAAGRSDRDRRMLDACADARRRPDRRLR